MPIRKTIAPCKDCAERSPGCWGKCEKYKAFCAENKAKKDNLRRRFKESNDFFNVRRGLKGDKRWNS